MAEPVSDEELLRLAHQVFPAMARHGVTSVYHLVRMAKHAEHHPRFSAALHAFLLVLDGKEHPEVTKAREALAAADVALTTAQNDLDAAGREIAKLRGERDQERAEKHDAKNRVHAVMAAGELAIRKLKRFDEAGARASSADMERALTEAAPKVRIGDPEVP